MAKDKKVKLSIMYYTAPQMQERDPAKAVKVLYSLVQELAEEAAELTKRVAKLEDKS
jgi:hypothetical protein